MMAWDFSTDPDHQPELEWARDFVRARRSVPTRRAAAQERFAGLREAVTSND